MDRGWIIRQFGLSQGSFLSAALSGSEDWPPAPVTKVTFSVGWITARLMTAQLIGSRAPWMSRWQITLGVAIVGVILAVQALARPFVVFPKAGELPSPDGRFVVRNADREGAASDFVGIFHSLWLIESATGRSRKLCDYVGVAAVAWSSNDFLVVTQYMGQQTSRALVFSADGSEDPVVLDKPTLLRLIPVELRDVLRENDHVFIEASRLENETLYLRVWGYGKHDANGFRWGCQYALREEVISCTETPTSK